MNNQMRWGLVTAASDKVDEAYRKAFAERRAHWAEHVRLADTEIIQMNVGDPYSIALVRVSWINEDTQEMNETMLRQSWKHHNGYFLFNEDIVGGDPGLFHGVDAIHDDHSNHGAETPTNTHTNLE